MLVTDIEINHYRYCSDRARHIADVCMTLKNQVVTLLCTVDLPADASGPSRVSAFVNDAVRQLRRMPELRSGKANLEFAEDFDRRALAG